MPSTKAKGKKRAFVAQNFVVAEIFNPVSSTCKITKPKREFRVCPVCQDVMPVQMLGTHAALEMQRVEDVCHARIDDDDLVPWEQIQADMASRSSMRSAALKARQSISAVFSNKHRPSLPSSSTRGSDLLAEVSKTIKLVQRHRRERHVKLKELFSVENEDDTQVRGSAGHQCPVCQVTVNGDMDVVEAHVDACLAHVMTDAAAASDADLEAAGLERYEAVGHTRIRIARAVDFRGAGFDVRNPLHNDVDDEIDVDGDDFGDAQFTENDLIITEGGLDGAEDVGLRVARGTDDASPTSRNRVENGLLDVAQRKAPIKMGTPIPGIVDTDSAAPEGFICRICIEVYTEPTVSTGCWHTCCKGCWLRCLGTTKLCPICKRITVAGDLRRIFL